MISAEAAKAQITVFGCCQFFVEDPAGSAADVVATTPPEVLISGPPLNLTNDSLFGYQEGNAAEIKFYLPVSA